MFYSSTRLRTSWFTKQFELKKSCPVSYNVTKVISQLSGCDESSFLKYKIMLNKLCRA